MKKFSFLLLFIAGIALAQSDVALQKIINAPKITWLGLDFTSLHLIEDPENNGFNDPEKIKSYYFNEWNAMVYAEPEKYDFKNFLQKDEVEIGLDEIKTWNEEVKIQEAIINSYDKNPSPERTNEELQSILNKYSYEGFSGIGLKLIITEMNKRNAMTTGYFTFFDIDSKQIIYTKKMESKAGGFGFRNYWLGSFYRMYDEIDYDGWMKDEKRKNRKR